MLLGTASFFSNQYVCPYPVSGLTIMIVFFLIQPLLLVQVRLKHDLFLEMAPIFVHNYEKKGKFQILGRK